MTLPRIPSLQINTPATTFEPRRWHVRTDYTYTEHNISYFTQRPYYMIIEIHVRKVLQYFSFILDIVNPISTKLEGYD